MEFAAEEDRQRLADQVSVNRIAHHGKPEHIKKLLKDLRTPWPSG